MSPNTKQAALRAASVAAMCVLGLLTGPAPAHASPPCSQWGFAGETNFNQSNGWTLTFDSTGQRAQGSARAIARNDNGPFTMSGTVEGGIDGYAVNLQVRWNGGEFGKYDGSVDANGFASGTTVDVRNPGSSASWSSGQPLRCITPR